MDFRFSIDIKGLKFSYPEYMGTKIPILKGIDLQVKPGEFLSVMGPTGAGKTTLCLALNGIVPHSSGGSFGGDVVICGENTKKATIASLAKKVGIVFQDPESQLFSMTVADEVAFGMENQGVPASEMRDRVAEMLEIVGMSAYAGRSPFALSGGQKQRVAIASMLAMSPEILVLDEPTSGLDPIGKSEVFKVVDRLRNEKNMTIIMVEHESERIAEFSDRVVILEDGMICLEGTPREVFKEVGKLTSLGVSSPQMAELSYSLREKGGSASFITLDEAQSYFGGGFA